MAIKEFKDYPNTETPLNADNINEVISEISTGWQSLGATITFLSADAPTFVVTTDIDCTGFIGLGNRLKCTHGGVVKYFLVTAITSNSITLYGGTDYTLSDTEITLPYYSNVKAPFGFPMDKNKWSIIYVDTTARTSGGTAVQNTYYNPGGLNFKFPIGLWDFSYQCYFGAYAGSTATQIKIQMALSTSPTSVSDAELLSYTETGMRSGTGNIIEVGIGSRSKEIKLTSPTTYYPIIQNVLSTVPGNMYFYNSDAPMIVKAVCGYL